MNLTSAQQTAIAARGNVLVVAGAGTGKTSTLVERCLACLLADQPPASLDEILMVTFTEAAAAEMRQRIRDQLEGEIKAHPDNAHLREQLALFDTAHIGTLHSFCLELVRQHFYELELDPQLAVLAEEEARLLADETLDSLLQEHYAGRTPAAEAVQQLIQTQGGGWDKPIRALVLRLHDYAQTLPDSAGWLAGQTSRFASRDPTDWQQWLNAALADYGPRWLPVLDAQAPQNEVARACAGLLRPLTPAAARTAAAEALEAVSEASRHPPPGRKMACLTPLKGFLGETEFLLSLARVEGGSDPLAEDWGWVRAHMTTLLGMAGEFTAAFTEAKRELGVVDFHDLEQFALRLLWDPQAQGPTRIARHWRHQLRHLFVDEYQDINAAQDKIIEALSREGAQANRLLVGDVKQSIYRFRLANPHIFQRYLEDWARESAPLPPEAGVPSRNNRREGAAADGVPAAAGAPPPAGQVILLVDNFRSRERLLGFVNSLFGVLMRRELGGVQYDERAWLRFGAPENRRPLSAGADPLPAVELHFRVKKQEPQGDDPAADALAEVADLEEARKEARLVALRLRHLQATGHPVWDEAARSFRPVAWSDMAVLLRSPANKAESYAKEFARLKIPLQVARGGFYQSTEISDILGLLQLLDNPLQDVPLLAVLHSPLVGMTLDELAAIRLAVKGPFWTALVRWEQSTAHGPELKVESPEAAVGNPKAPLEGQQMDLPPGHETAGKVSRFLERYARWRRLARQVSLARCLEAVLAETHYAEWLLTQPRGEQRHANVQRLLGLALEFDHFQRQGLFRFLRFIEAQRLAETEPEVAAVNLDNCVRLMSIHQAKGLEFPVVALADLGKPFNTSDLRADVILDEEYGLCPQIKPPHTGKRYPSLPWWLARRRQTLEMLGEELRLLYVAMTRARDTLLVSGSISSSQGDRLWQPVGELGPAKLASARSYADWLGWWFASNCGAAAPGTRHGQNDLVRWEIHDDTSLVEPADAASAAEPALPGADSRAWEALERRLLWAYPFLAATLRPAKAAVTALRRGAGDQDQEAASLFGGQPTRPSPAKAPAPTQPPRARRSGGKPGATAAALAGQAHHAFLELVPLAAAGAAPEMRRAAKRLQEQGLLAEEDVGLLDFGGLAAFWQSDLGGKIRGQAQFVRRELAFTARFSPQEIAAITGEPLVPGLEDEFIVVQGVADLAVVLPAEIWLVDFKTDAVEPSGLDERARLYAPQVKLYARALSQIYRRPVSAAWLYFLQARTAVPVQ